MPVFVQNNFAHVLFVLILISRLGDIGSTYLVSPKLSLEANPIVKKLGWGYAILTLSISFIAYWDTAVGVAALVLSLLVSASNISKIWMVRTLGEEEYSRLLQHLVRRSKLSHALSGVMASASFILLLGAVTIALCPDSTQDWGYWIGCGIVLYGVAIAFYGSLHFVRLFKNISSTV